jgi:hypothetical protein
MLAAPLRNPQAGQWISHSGGWALLLARHLIEAQGGRLDAEFDGATLTFAVTLATANG